LQSLAPAPGSLVPHVEPVGGRVRSIAVVLSRLFRALARLDEAAARDPHPARVADTDLWASVAHLLEDLAEIAGDETALQVEFEPAPAPPAAGTGGNGATSPSVPDCAAALAAGALDVNFEHLIEQREDAWNDLVAAVRRRTSPLDARAEDDAMDTYSRLLAALPTDLRRDFRRFAESRALESIIERQAAFELGRHVERQTAPLVRTRTA
jgi:hypothetical protein